MRTGREQMREHSDTSFRSGGAWVGSGLPDHDTASDPERRRRHSIPTKAVTG